MKCWWVWEETKPGTQLAEALSSVPHGFPVTEMGHKQQDCCWPQRKTTDRQKDRALGRTKRSAWMMQQQAPAEELLNSLWCSESLTGRAGHKGVCLAMLPGRSCKAPLNPPHPYGPLPFPSRGAQVSRQTAGSSPFTTTSWKTSYLASRLQNTPDNHYRKPAQPPPQPAGLSLRPGRLHSWPPAAFPTPAWYGRTSQEEQGKRWSWSVEKTSCCQAVWRGGLASEKLVSNLLWFASTC